jgi:outer membrane protein
MKRIILIFAFAGIVIAAQSQETLSVLTFEDAIKIGIDKNINLHTQNNQLYANQARKLQGYANFLPNLNANGFAQRTDGLQIDPTTGQAGNVSSDYIQGSIQANFVVFNGFNRINTVRQNNALFSAQSNLVDRTRQDVVYTVTSQYLQVLLDQELLRIAEENMNTQNVLLEQMQGFVSVGSRPASDEYNQNALVQNFKVTYLRARMTLENDRALLAQTLQLDPTIPFIVKIPAWENDIADFQSLSLDSLFQIAIKSRPDLKQQLDLVDGNKHGMRAATAGYYPQVSLFVNYGSTYYATDTWKLNPGAPRPETFATQFTELNPALSYGININIPIFDRLVTRTNRVVAKVAYENAVLTRDNLEKTIKIDVQRFFKNYETEIESYQASIVQYEAGSLAMQTQQESYNLGIASQVALAQANQVFVQAAASRAQAEVTLIFQKMLLEYALGTLRVDNLFGQE